MTPGCRWLTIVLLTSTLLAASARAGGAAVPGAATPIAPSGVITGTTHVFTFQSAAAATFYYFQLTFPGHWCVRGGLGPVGQ
jgi:hypothetical protein